MTARRIQIIANGTKAAHVTYDNEFEEYRVALVEQDQPRNPDADYYTDDYDDAIGTACNIVGLDREAA